jgi:serine/threonine protein kinase
MTPERWKQIEELYHSAVDSGEEARAVLFAHANPEVRGTVIEMLAQQSSENILDRPAWEGAAEMDRAAPPLTPETQLGPYRIEGILGQGGMGAVYRAFDSRLGRKVAIKILSPALAADPERLRRFEQEAWAAGTLDHPNVLTIYDVGTHDDTSYLVSELLEGETLRDRLRGGALPRHKALEYARLIAAGLTAAHERGITHRDLKPENLFITRDGRLKILDFGLAKFTGTESNLETLSERIKVDPPSSGSQPGIILGTVGYMSPEQVQAEAVDHRSDLFNLGAILYEMLTGRRAFQGTTPIQTLQAILKEEPPLSDDDPQLGAALARFLRHCLEKDPRERFQSAKDLSFDLEALGLPSSTAAPSSAKWKFTTVAALCALVLILFLAGRRFPFVVAVQPPSFRQITFRPGLVTSGRFTRDGQTVVYSAAWEGRPVESFTTRTDGPESRPLDLPSAAGVLGVSSAGELLLTLGCQLNWAECRGTIARMPIEGKAPREIVDDADYADWNPEGTNFLIVRGIEGRYRLEYPIGKVLYETAGWITHPRFSPKGDRIAFLNHPTLGNNDGSVEMVDLDGHKTTLVAGLKGLKGLAWSSSGEEVWFSGSPKRNPVLYAVTLASKQRVVLETPGGMEIQDIARDGRVLLLQQTGRSNMIYRPPGASNDRALSWFDWSTAADLSANAKTLLFYEWGEGTGGVPTIYLRETGGGEAVGLGEGKPLALAPDGKWVLALRGRPPSQLTLLPTGAGEPKLLPRSGIQEYYSGAWFPGGKKILFSGETSDHIPRSFIQDVEGGEAHAVTAGGMRATLISPDGTQLAAYGPEGDYYLANIGGGEPRGIRGTERGDELIQWSADGRFLYVKGSNQSYLELFRIDLINGTRQPWKKLEVPDKVGFVGIQNGPGAIRITPDGKSYVYTSWQALGELYIAEGLK